MGFTVWETHQLRLELGVYQEFLLDLHRSQVATKDPEAPLGPPGGGPGSLPLGSADGGQALVFPKGGLDPARQLWSALLALGACLIALTLLGLWCQRCREQGGAESWIDPLDTLRIWPIDSWQNSG